MNSIAERQPPVRAVVIDDTEDIRNLLRIVLTRGGMRVVGEAGDGLSGIELVRAERPDLVMLDLSMPVMDGLAALPDIRMLVPESLIVVLTAYVGDNRDKILAGGADTLMDKTTPLHRIVEYVEEQLSA